MSKNKSTSKLNDPEMDKKLEKMFYDLRNGFVSVSLLASLNYANKNGEFPWIKKLALMSITILNPEKDSLKIAGLTSAYPMIMELLSNLSERSEAKDERRGVEALIKKSEKGLEITDTGKKFLKFEIEEIKRILSILEDLEE